jgi:cysteinyl-tRNA synthetase
MLRLTNTLSGKKEEFKALRDREVGMYNCGPTVYDRAHIGNLRAYIFTDILRRTLEYLSFRVKQVVNITDIGHLSGDNDYGEDKMTKALKREGRPLTLEAMRELANSYFQIFKDDLAKLNIKTPDHFPFASDHIKEDVELIQKLTERNFTYKTSDGIYFDTSKKPSYGQLGGFTAKSEDATSSRIGINSEKRNQKDFALWKFNEELGYEAPFGKGFPGWHIECSAMSMKYLGETFDIHTGGIDHIPIHHNNEIAQSESATGKQFVRFWLHSAFVNMQEGKMAKSEENVIYLKNLEDRGIHPLAYRFWILQAHYSSPITFSWEALEAAQNGFESLLRRVSAIKTDGNRTNSFFEVKFRDLFEDDLNTPEALALIGKLIDSDITDEEKLGTLYKIDEILGLRLRELSKKMSDIPPEIQLQQKEIDRLRAEKKFSDSDILRSDLDNLYIVENTTNGTRTTRRLTPDL